jgi:hypothetical protein
MNDLYLITHKVRRELAFDVAQRVHLSSGEDIWFVPTSGHRAYPLQYRALPVPRVSADLLEGSAWAALPDHYSPTQREGSMARLRARLREIWRALPRPAIA